MYYINKIKQNFHTFCEYFKEHLLFFVFIPTIFIALCFGATKLPVINITENNLIKEQIIIIAGLSIQNWATILSILILAPTAFWAIYQYQKNRKSKQQEKAVEVAKYFSEDILIKLGIINSVILDSKLGEIINPNNFTYTQFKNFDKNEIISLYNDDDEIFFKIRTELNSEELQQAYLKYISKRVLLSKDYFDKEHIISGDEAKNLFILGNSTLPFKFVELISNTLNNIEYICMNLSSQAAGSKYVYQSLHQLFLLTIKTLAPIISMNNANHFDKYYTNIIHVYNYWCSINEDKKKKEKQRIKKVEKTLNPKIETI